MGSAQVAGTRVDNLQRDYGERVSILRRLAPGVVGLVSSAWIASACGCDGCQRKPYTPYMLSDNPAVRTERDGAAGPNALDAGRAHDDALELTAVAANVAPGDGTTWPLTNGAAMPPPGRRFESGIVLDADGDGTANLVAWGKTPDGLGGNVWFVSGTALATLASVVTVPVDVAEPGCLATASLSQVGARTLWIDFLPRCSGSTHTRVYRWMAAIRLRPHAPPEPALELRLRPPAEGGPWTLPSSESTRIAMDRPISRLRLPCAALRVPSPPEPR